jgi:hypothetical protein
MLKHRHSFRRAESSADTYGVRIVLDFVEASKIVGSLFLPRSNLALARCDVPVHWVRCTLDLPPEGDHDCGAVAGAAEFSDVHRMRGAKSTYNYSSEGIQNPCDVRNNVASKVPKSNGLAFRQRRTSSSPQARYFGSHPPPWKVQYGRVLPALVLCIRLTRPSCSRDLVWLSLTLRAPKRPY